MKKKILLLAIITLCLFVGCKKNSSEASKTPVVGGWETDFYINQVFVPEEARNVFQSAIENEPNQYELVALLGTQVVAGTNYMFLAVENHEQYKVLVVYNDLENNIQITNNNTLDIDEYVNKYIANPGEELVGGWETEIPEFEAILKPDAKAAFDITTSSLPIKYTAITQLAHQVVSGMNYAILAYGSENDHNGIYILTIYEDTNHNPELKSQAYVKLADFNQ